MGHLYPSLSRDSTNHTGQPYMYVQHTAVNTDAYRAQIAFPEIFLPG
jgi:hypothetical protein